MQCESKETFGHQLWERLLTRAINRSERGSLVSKETMAHQLLDMKETMAHQLLDMIIKIGCNVNQRRHLDMNQ